MARVTPPARRKQAVARKTFETDNDPFGGAFDGLDDDIFADPELDEVTQADAKRRKKAEEEPKKKRDLTSAKGMAAAIEDRYPQLEIRYIVGRGNKVYPNGCWAIEKWASDKGAGGYHRLRYMDEEQLAEIYGSLGDSDKFWRLVNGQDEPGPLRVGKPAMDAKGKVIEFIPDPGYGDLPDECKWIEAHENVVIRYMGSDDVWPTGCWEMQHEDGTDLYTAAQICHIAYEVHGMSRASIEVGDVFAGTYEEEADPFDDIFAAEDEAEEGDPFADVDFSFDPNDGSLTPVAHDEDVWGNDKIDPWEDHDRAWEEAFG